MVEFLHTAARGKQRAALVLAHGAGAPMDSPFMSEIAGLLVDRGIAVLRFEFPYMAARRVNGVKRPPPRAEALLPVFAEAVAAAGRLIDGSPLLIGGKSLGGRVAAMLAGSPDLDSAVAGIVCLGYPFHPPGKPDALRLAPLLDSRRPVLICQGERDSFGSRTEVEAYGLPAKACPPEVETGSGKNDMRNQKLEHAVRFRLDAACSTIELVWLADGSHDLKPRKSAGLSHADNLARAASAVAEFAARLVSGSAGTTPSA